MEKKTKVIGGAAFAIMLALAGGATLTAAAVAPAPTNQVQQSDNGIEDGTNDGETADDGVEDGTNDGEIDDDGVQDGPGAQNEDTSDDVNGVEVEDGTAD
jgi:hypothetical protein